MLIRHSFIYTLAKIGPGLLGMATTALLTHMLEPEIYGLYGLALVVMTFGSTIAFEWLGISFMRFYQARRDDPLIFSTFIQMFLLLVGATAVVALAAWACGAFTGEHALIYTAGLVMMWTYAWFELIARFEVAAFRPMRYLALNAVRSLLILAGAAGAAWFTRDPVWTAVGTAAGTGISAIFGGFRGWRIGRRYFDPALAKAVIGFGFPMALSLALSSLLMTGTRALVEVLDSPAALGLYTAAVMLIQNTLVFVASGVASAAYSMAVRAVESGDPVAAERQLRANGTLLLAIAAPASLGLSLTGHAVASTLVGAKYVDALTVLTPWMAAGAFLGTIRASYLDHAFQLGRRPQLQVWVTGVAAVIAIGLSLLLIPRLGPLGAAIASMVAMGFSCVHAWIAGRYAYPVPLPLAAAAKIAVSCAVMAAAVLAIPGTGTTALVLQVVMGGIAYGATVVLLNILGLRDRLAETLQLGLRRLARFG